MPDRLKSWERWAIGAVLALMVAFGGIVLNRSAFLELRRTDADVFFRAGWAVRTGHDLYDTVSERGWSYVYPQFFAILMTPLADPPTPRTFEVNAADMRTLGPMRGLTPEQAEQRALVYEQTGRDLSGLLSSDTRWYMPFAVSVAIWYAVSLASLLLAVHLVASACTIANPRLAGLGLTPAHRGWWTLRLWPLIFALPSAGNALSRGQVDLLVLLGIAMLIFGMVQCRRWSAGIGLALAGCVKVIPGLLAIVPLWRRDWRLVATTAVGVLMMLVVIPAAVRGPSVMIQDNIRWVQTTALPAFGLGSDISRKAELISMTANDSQSFKSILHNWSQWGTPRGERSSEPGPFVRFAAIGASLLMLAITLWAARWRVPGLPRAAATTVGPIPLHRDPTAPLLVGCVCCVMIAASPISHLHYFVFALPLLITLCARPVADHPAQSLPAWLWLVGFGYLVAYAVPRLPGMTAVVDIGLMMIVGVALWAWGIVELRRLSHSMDGPPPCLG